MSLEADIGLSLGTLDLQVQLRVEPGEVVAVLGPNGAGKSTVLRALAGLLPLERGCIGIDEPDRGRLVLDDPAAGVWVPPEARPVGVVFQDSLLFPHLSALENVAFGLRARGVGKVAARQAAGGWLARVGLGDRAGHRPHELSGGQAQRVALARALATDPLLLLLDEPLSALDVATRGEVRRDLRKYLDGFEGMRVLVTHDPVDAFALADRVVVLEAGRVVQTGTLGDVTAHPRSRYVAELVGINLLRGQLTAGVLHTDDGVEVVAATDQPDGPAFAAIRPQALSLYRTRPEGSPRNAWPVTVADIDQRADRVRVRVEGAIGLVAEITPGALDALALRPGEAVWAGVKASEVTTYRA